MVYLSFFFAISLLSFIDINVPNGSEEHVSVTTYSARIDRIIASALPVQFRFVQSEHRGGFCDCWALANLTVTPPSGQITEL